MQGHALKYGHVVLLFLATSLLLNPAHAASSRWRLPPQQGSWDWQLSRPINLSVKVDILDIDPDLVTREQIRELKARGVYLICYVSVGTWEKWRRDAKAFPRRVLGRRYDEWPDERFLDIRKRRILLPIMKARFRRCKRLGFDAIEADNIDLHENRTGFPIRRRHVVRYMRALTRAAHKMGLAIAQKNAPDLTRRLSRFMDFAVTEACYNDGWCSDMYPYIWRGRAVLDAEYREENPNMEQACRYARDVGISMILKDRDLTAWRRDCAEFE